MGWAREAYELVTVALHTGSHAEAQEPLNGKHLQTLAPPSGISDPGWMFSMIARTLPCGTAEVRAISELSRQEMATTSVRDTSRADARLIGGRILDAGMHRVMDMMVHSRGCGSR